jgi:hypothetical protein
MPVVLVDSEQAALMEAAFAMLEAALTARVERADPEKIISNSLTLQAMKLATVRTLLKAPEPPAWSELPLSTRSHILAIANSLPELKKKAEADQLYFKMRGLVNAPGLPTA